MKAFLDGEFRNHKSWWYLSGPAGAAMIEAHGPASALYNAHVLDIHPGGDVAVLAVPPGFEYPESYRNRRLSRAEMRTGPQEATA